MTPALQVTKSRSQAVGFLFVAILMVVLFLPVVARAVTDSADYQDHIRDARLWAEAGLGLDKAIRPHFFYHILVIIVHAFLPGGDWSTAAIIVGTALYILLGLILYALLHPIVAGMTDTNRGIAAAITLTTGLMLVSPITIPMWDKQKLYLGYLALHTYHSPTQVVLKPFALLFFYYTTRIFSSERPGWSVIAVTFALGLASTLSKPSYAICIIPAVGLFTLYYLYKRRKIHWLLLIIGFGGSLGLVLGWQYFFHRSSMGGFAFRPFQVMDFYSPGDFILKGMLSIVFPVCVYVTYFQRARERLELNLSWLAFIIAAAYTYLLVEPAEWQSGNFTWSAQITLLILFVFSTLFVLRIHNFSKPREWGWQFYLCATAWILHLVSGILWYAIQLTEGLYQWW